MYHVSIHVSCCPAITPKKVKLLKELSDLVEASSPSTSGTGTTTCGTEVGVDKVVTRVDSSDGEVVVRNKLVAGMDGTDDGKTVMMTAAVVDGKMATSVTASTPSTGTEGFSSSEVSF